MDKNEVEQYIDKNLLTKQEAMAITGQSLTAFNQAVATGKLLPFYDHGKERGRVRLYLKEDVEDYAKGVNSRRKRLEND